MANSPRTRLDPEARGEAIEERKFEWQFAQRLSLHFRLYHSVGSSDDSTRDYTENRAYVGIRYTGGDGGTNGGGS